MSCTKSSIKSAKSLVIKKTAVSNLKLPFFYAFKKGISSFIFLNLKSDKHHSGRSYWTGSGTTVQAILADLAANIPFKESSNTIQFLASTFKHAAALINMPG
jgi:hypothetical protein